MLWQLFVGTLAISVCVAIHVAFIVGGSGFATLVGARLAGGPHALATTLALVVATLWIMAAHTVGVWLWAFLYLAVGAFEALEPAVYFSVVAYTTLGLGDITLSPEWRLLCGLAAANGLILFGLSTAFLVEFLAETRRAQLAASRAGSARGNERR